MSTTVPTELPAAGDRYTIVELTGYTLTQYRPGDCRSDCVCGECDGRRVSRPGTITEVIHYADNSIEATVRCDDDQVRIARLTAPQGDRC